MTRLSTKILLTAALSVFIGGQAVHAQNRSSVAEIPFAFRTAGQTMPAGTYRIAEKTSTGVYQLTQKTTGHSLFSSFTIPDGGPPASSKLTFACYGHECVLAGVSINGATHSDSVPPSTIDKNLSRNLRLATMISVPLRAR